MPRCPFLNERCLGKPCGNFDATALKCRGDNPTAKWARWYLEHDFTKKETNA